MNARVRERIDDHRLGELDDEMTVGELYGMQTFDQSLVQLYRNGLVERTDAVAHASAPGEMRFSLDRADLDRERAVSRTGADAGHRRPVRRHGACSGLTLLLVVVEGTRPSNAAREQRRAGVEHVLELRAGTVVRATTACAVGAGAGVGGSGWRTGRVERQPRSCRVRRGVRVRGARSSGRDGAGARVSMRCRRAHPQPRLDPAPIEQVPAPRR